MKLWIQSLLVTVFLFSGCTTIPKPQDDTTTDTTLPKVRLTSNGVYADINAIAFEWNSIEDPRVEGVYIYKQDFNSKNSTKLHYYKTIPSRFSTHFVDNKIKPNSMYAYSFTTYSKNSESSPNGLIKIKSLPTLNSVSWIHSINGLPKSAKILWRPHSNKKVSEYIIERKSMEDSRYTTIATVEGRLNAEYIDNDLEDNRIYTYRIRVATFDNIISNPSKSVKVITKKLPPAVTNLSATTKLPKKIKLRWDRTSLVEYKYYNLYRSTSPEGKYSFLAKVRNNSYTDKINQDEKTYFYRVTVVDKDTLESHVKDSIVMGKTLSKPSAPYFVQSKLLNNKIEIVWKSNDSRAVSYTVTRTIQNGWFEKKKKLYKGIKSKRFIDRDIESASTYLYKIYAIDKYGIVSRPSKTIEIKTLKADSVMQIKDGETIFQEMPVKEVSEEEVIERPINIKEEEIAPMQQINAIEDLDLSEL
jgi:hypothetical protein